MTYDRRAVQAVLPAVWDETYAWGIQEPTAPPPDMPRSASNKAHSNTLYAVLADVRTAWSKAELTRDHRAALLLVFGFGMTHKEAGYFLERARSSVTEDVDAGLGLLVEWLNG